MLQTVFGLTSASSFFNIGLFAAEALMQGAPKTPKKQGCLKPISIVYSQSISNVYFMMVMMKYKETAALITLYILVSRNILSLYAFGLAHARITTLTL